MRHTKLSFLSLFLLILLPAQRAQATFYVRGPVEKDEYIATFVEQVSYPRFSKGMFGPYLYNSYEHGANFYSGLVHKGLAERCAFGTTFWQGSMENRVEILNSGPYFFPLSSISEGASGSAGGNIPFMKEDTWYQIVYKIWQPSKGGNSLFGIWLQEVDKGVWHSVVTAQLPIVSNGFNGATGFIEPLNKEPQVHRIERRKSYGYFNGKGWRSMNKLTVNGGKKNVNNLRFWKIINNDKEQKQEIFFAAKEEKRLPDFNVPHGEKKDFYFQQPEKPSFPELTIQSTKAEKFGSQVKVSWQMPENSTPIIDSRLEFLDASGKILETTYAPRLYVTELCASPKREFANIRLIVTDLFNQEAVQIIDSATDSTAMKPQLADASSLAAGVEFEYFASPRGDFQSLADMEGKKFTNYGITPYIDLSIHEGPRRKNAYAAKYHGYLHAPEDGYYQFHFRVSDGYAINIAGKEIKRDGESGLDAQIFTLALKKGYHPVHVDYFHSRANEGYLLIDWIQPGSTQASPIAPEYLFHSTEGKAAVPNLKLVINDEKAPVIAVSLQGALPEEVKEVRYFASGKLWRRSDQAPFAIEGGAVSGKHHYLAKIYFDDGRVWSTPILEYTSENFMVENSPWTYEASNEAKSSSSYTFTGEKLTISGRGTHEFRREIQGDFTLKARIDKLEGGDKRSFIALGKAKDRFAIFSATHQGISIPSHQRNFGGGGFASLAVVKGEEPFAPWICLANKGGRMTTYYSYDGENWHKANEAYFDGNLGDATIHFESKLSEGEPFLKVALSQISWEDRFDPALEPSVRKIVLNLDNQSILGLVSGGGNIAYARTKAGLLKSDDFGKSWYPFVGKGAEKADGIIRSLAVSPHDPQLMFAAEIDKGQSKLLKSTNGGNSWQSVPSPVSFTGDTLALLSGELIDFHPTNEAHIALGGKGGVYLSTDAGKSWQLHELKDKDISFVRWHEAAITLKKGHALYAGITGESMLHAWNLEGRDTYRKIPTAAPVFDVRFQPADYVSWFYVLTTRGLYETVNGGKKLMQMHSPEPLSLREQSEGIVDQPITAVALSAHSKPSTTQRTMVAFSMLTDPKSPQSTYLKGSFKASLPISEGELMLKALDHPSKNDMGIVGTNKGLYFTQGDKGLYRGKFKPSKVKP